VESGLSPEDSTTLIFDDRTAPENLAKIADKHPGLVKTPGEAVDAWLKQTGERLPSGSM